MPIFEYFCTKCKELFEELVANGDVGRMPYPVCRSKKHVQKLVSAPFKGRGSRDLVGRSSEHSSCASRPFT